MKKDGIKSWADLYVLLRESYESNKLFNENFGCCKEDTEMAEKHLDISFTDRKEEEGYGLKGVILFEEEGNDQEGNDQEGNRGSSWILY